MAIIKESPETLQVMISVQYDPVWLGRFIAIIGQFNRGLITEDELSNYLVLDLDLSAVIDLFAHGWTKRARTLNIAPYFVNTSPVATIRLIITKES